MNKLTAFINKQINKRKTAKALALIDGNERRVLAGRTRDFFEDLVSLPSTHAAYAAHFVAFKDQKVYSFEAWRTDTGHINIFVDGDKVLWQGKAQLSNHPAAFIKFARDKQKELGLLINNIGEDRDTGVEMDLG